MNNKLIKEALKKLVSEEKTPGITNTKKVQDESGKFNKEAQKEVGKKMKDYDKGAKEDELDEKVVNKVNATDDQKEYHDQMEIRNGQEMIKYDQEPSKRFKERAEMALKGDSTMGNEVKTGKWNPETGEGNGNTEPVWGASDAKFGEKLINTANAADKKRNDATGEMKLFGDDAEYPTGGKTTKRASKKTAFQEGEENKKEVIKENTGMKRLRFKNEFGGPEKAVKLIPEHYKVDSKEFEMTDGNETYRVRWEGNLNEGEAVILSAKNQKMINEDIEKMKKLWGFQSKDTLGKLKPEQRANENKEFKNVWDKTKNLLK
jgi:hypothetical protein